LRLVSHRLELYGTALDSTTNAEKKGAK
jgi:hypothetical protein